MIFGGLPPSFIPPTIHFNTGNQLYPITFTAANSPLFITFRILKMDRMARRHPQVLVKVKMNNAADTAYHTLEYYLKFDPCPKASIAFTHNPKPSPMIF
jgi:hypothetical protein